LADCGLADQIQRPAAHQAGDFVAQPDLVGATHQDDARPAAIR
jgi:hypothetical protein